MDSLPPQEVVYPTSDGRSMDSDLHRDLMCALIETLKRFFAGKPSVYVSGNLLVFYVRGDHRLHVSPDVFVVFGVPNRLRDNYLVWEEGESPHVVIELTSSSTREEDVDEKYRLYRLTLKVREYFLFDPNEDYLEPSLQGYRLEDGQYVPIAAVAGRLPSEVLGLHLERYGTDLRLYDPVAAWRLPTIEELIDQNQAEVERLRRRSTPEA